MSAGATRDAASGEEEVLGLADALGWFSKLALVAHRACAGGGTGLLEALGGHTCEQEVESTQVHQSSWMSFDLADAMEMGMAREATDRLIAAEPSDALFERRLLIEVSSDHTRHVLTTEEHETLLVAQVVDDRGKTEMYIPTAGEPPTCEGPAFTLSPTASPDTGRGKASKSGPASWALSCSHCTCGCGEYVPHYGCARPPCACERILAHIRSAPVMAHGCKVMHVEACLPTLREGGPEVWCSRSMAESSGKFADDCRLKLVSRRPRWNSKRSRPTMDFFGRCTRPSARNFQLRLAETDESVRRKPELLHGRVGENLFVLDYKYPLSMVQAFAIALSTQRWAEAMKEN